MQKPKGLGKGVAELKGADDLDFLQVNWVAVKEIRLP